MSKHTPLIRLQAARRAHAAAVEQCPHWDYTDGTPQQADCCRAMWESYEELKAAKNAAGEDYV